ncbi:MAG: hypothetical protein KatS3mg057_1495 [Herpetosiphonaceae bacterium]|nr:MAG: hypothetical protein KatS3mg057_1495 [Herpetosiphonaceae bacterium]
MGWRFRKSVKIFPGVRLNISKRGISTTVGVRGASVTFGQRGTYLNIGLPGTGLSYRTRIDTPVPPTPGLAALPSAYSLPVQSPIPSPFTPQTEEPGAIKSQNVEEVTSPGLYELRELLISARNERNVLLQEIQTAAMEKQKIDARWVRLNRSFFARKFRKKAIAECREQGLEAQAKLAELEEQLKLCNISLSVDIDEAFLNTYLKVVEYFRTLCGAHVIWDVTSSQYHDPFVTRSTAAHHIRRTRVVFDTTPSPIIQAEYPVMHLANANGADIYIYPGFLMMVDNRTTAFALVDFREVQIEFIPVGFLEEEQVPGDTVIVDYAWARANKDGSRDRRFADNYQIPVVAYGNISIRSPSGVNEQYMVSNQQSAENFTKAMQAYIQLFRQMQG